MDFQQVVQRILGFLPALATAIVALGPILGAVIAVGGGFGRVARNSLAWIDAALICALLAVLVATAAILVAIEGKERQHISARATVLSVTFITLGLLAFGNAATRSAALQEQVSLRATVSFDKGLVVRGTATTTGARAGDRMVVDLWGRRPEGTYSGRPVWQGSGGPDAAGRIDVPIDSTVSPGLYDAVIIRAFTAGEVVDGGRFDECRSGDGAALSDISGCMVLPLPVLGPVPHVSGGVQGTGDSRAVRVDIRAWNLSTDHRIGFAVYGLNDGEAPSLLQQGLLSPDNTASLLAEHVITVGQRFDSVCITAEPIIVRPRPGSSPTPRPNPSASALPSASGTNAPPSSQSPPSPPPSPLQTQVDPAGAAPARACVPARSTGTFPIKSSTWLLLPVRER